MCTASKKCSLEASDSPCEMFTAGPALLLRRRMADLRIAPRGSNRSAETQGDSAVPVRKEMVG